jgi:hypothetical protein
LGLVTGVGYWRIGLRGRCAEIYGRVTPRDCISWQGTDWDRCSGFGGFSSYDKEWFLYIVIRRY